MAEIIEKVSLTETQKKRQHRRSVAIAFTLGALVLIFYAITIVKMGPGVMNRPL
nr:hypothetical protein [uncultured Cohaesibacter sp.]